MTTPGTCQQDNDDDSVDVGEKVTEQNYTQQDETEKIIQSISDG